MHLTPRQEQVLRGLLKGHRAKKIAKDMGITTGTVNATVFNIKLRLGVQNLPDLIRWGDKNLK
jgi:two-component system response regulator FixJ